MNVVLFVDSYEETQIMLKSVSTTAARIGLKINVNKRKCFHLIYKMLINEIVTRNDN